MTRYQFDTLVFGILVLINQNIEAKDTLHHIVILLISGMFAYSIFKASREF